MPYLIVLIVLDCSINSTLRKRWISNDRSSSIEYCISRYVVPPPQKKKRSCCCRQLRWQQQQPQQQRQAPFTMYCTIIPPQLFRFPVFDFEAFCPPHPNPLVQLPSPPNTKRQRHGVVIYNPFFPNHENFPTLQKFPGPFSGWFPRMAGIAANQPWQSYQWGRNIGKSTVTKTKPHSKSNDGVLFYFMFFTRSRNHGMATGFLPRDSAVWPRGNFSTKFGTNSRVKFPGPW